MKVKVYFKDGSSRIVDLGEVDPFIKRHREAMLLYMLLILKGEEINLKDIKVILTTNIIKPRC